MFFAAEMNHEIILTAFQHCYLIEIYRRHTMLSVKMWKFLINVKILNYLQHKFVTIYAIKYFELESSTKQI